MNRSTNRSLSRATSRPTSGGLLWTPQNAFGSALVASYAGYLQTGYADAALATTLTDQSGSGHHAAGGPTTQSPTYKTNQLNGKACFRFTIGSSTYATASFTLAQPYTVLCVLRQFATAGAGNETAWDGATLNTGRIFDNALIWTMYAGAFGPSVGRQVTNTSHYLEAFYVGASSTLRLDNGSVNTGDASTGSPGGVTLGAGGGASAFGSYDIFDFNLVNRVLTAAERASYAAYVNRVFGL